MAKEGRCKQRCSFTGSGKRNETEYFRTGRRPVEVHHFTTRHPCLRTPITLAPGPNIKRSRTQASAIRQRRSALRRSGLVRRAGSCRRRSRARSLPMHDVLPATQPSPLTLRRHIVDTVRLAAPLAVAQVTQIAMGITDMVLLGSLGSDALAVGGLGTGLFFTTVLVLQGVLSAVAVLVSQARGAGKPERAPAIFRTGLLLTILLATPAFALLSAAEPILLALGQPP